MPINRVLAAVRCGFVGRDVCDSIQLHFERGVVVVVSKIGLTFRSHWLSLHRSMYVGQSEL